MGLFYSKSSQLSIKKQKENKFWIQWYKDTGDFSVGPQTTWQDGNPTHLERSTFCYKQHLRGKSNDEILDSKNEKFHGFKTS